MVRNSSTVRNWLSQNCRFMLVVAGSNGRSHFPVITVYYVSSSAGWAHYWLLLGVQRRVSWCVLCLSCHRALCALCALLTTTAHSFRIVGKLWGNLFIADQSRAASHAPSHYILLAPRTSHFTITLKKRTPLISFSDSWNFRTRELSFPDTDNYWTLYSYVVLIIQRKKA